MALSACGAPLAVTAEESTGRTIYGTFVEQGAGNLLSNPDYFAATRGSNAISSFDTSGGGRTRSQLYRVLSNGEWCFGVGSEVYKEKFVVSGG